jgi:DNA polymerase-3 subunit beta
MRKLTGNFPDYQRTVGYDFPSHAFLPAKEMLKAIDRVAVYSDERSKYVRFEIRDGVLTIFSSTVETGSAASKVPLAGGEIAGPLEIGFNAGYVRDFLALYDNHVALCWKDEKSAAQLLSDDGHAYVVMPMRID